MQCTCTCNVYALRNASSGWSWFIMREGISVFGDYSEEEEEGRRGRRGGGEGGRIEEFCTV